MFALECRCARHIFRQWQKECCHGNGILWQKWGKNLASGTTSSHENWWKTEEVVRDARFSPHFCHNMPLPWQHTFYHCQKCVLHIYTPRQTSVPNLFFTNSHEIWHRCLPWDVDVQDTFFDSGRKCVAMVIAYYGKNGGKNLASRTTSSVFHQFSWNLAQMFALGCRCARHIFDSGRKCVAMVTAYYGKNGGKILRRELLPQFFTNSHEIWHRCLPLGVDVQDTFFDSGRKCVAMVTAYYPVKKYCGAGVLITFSDISSFQLSRISFW